MVRPTSRRPTARRTTARRLLGRLAGAAVASGLALSGLVVAATPAMMNSRSSRVRPLIPAVLALRTLS